MVSATTAMVVLLGYQTYDIARADYGFTRNEGAMLLGLLGLAQFLPLLLLTPVAGWAADRFDRRVIAALGAGCDCVIAATLALLTWQEALNLPILFILSAMHGGARVFLGPSMSSIAPNIVPSAVLPKAIAMNSISWQSAGVIGPALGGLIYAKNAALPHAISAIAISISIFLVMRIRPIRAKQSATPASPIAQMVDGAKFTWGNRFLLGCISLDLFAVLLAGATALLPVYARDILHVGPEGLGIMRGAPAIGAGIVAAIFAVRPLKENVGERMLWAVVIFGAATVVFGLSRDFTLSLAALGILGAADMVSVFIRSTLVQLNTPDEMRGRVSSISVLAISASNELGEMQSGLAAGALGATGAVVFGGFGAIVVTALWAWIFPELRRAKHFTSEFLEQPKSEKTP